MQTYTLRGWPTYESIVDVEFGTAATVHACCRVSDGFEVFEAVVCVFVGHVINAGVWVRFEAGRKYLISHSLPRVEFGRATRLEVVHEFRRQAWSAEDEIVRSVRGWGERERERVRDDYLLLGVNGGGGAGSNSEPLILAML